MKRILIIAALPACIALAVCIGILCACEYQDRQQCVCSMLTEEEQTFSIDDRLYRLCERDTMKSGVFMYVRTSCDHGRNLHLTVFPDEGIFKGYILKN